MEAKHYGMIGYAVKRQSMSKRAIQLSDIELGKMMHAIVRIAEQEAERDARDKANGKGE
jgi:hypothetical protein